MIEDSPSTEIATSPPDAMKMSPKVILDQRYLLNWPEKPDWTYTVLKRLGAGAYGRVDKVVLSSEKARYDAGDNTVKVYAHKTFINTDFHTALNSASRELHNLLVLRDDNKVCNPDVACFIDNYIGEQNRSVCIVTEFISGQTVYEVSLSNYKSGRKVDVFEYRRLLLSALRGLKFMHSRNVAHRDIYGPNIMIINYGHFTSHVVFIDYGLACVGAEDCREQPHQIPQHMSPEMLQAQIDRSLLNMPEYKASDVWFLALAFYSLNTGQPLFAIQRFPADKPSSREVRDAEALLSDAVNVGVARDIETRKRALRDVQRAHREGLITQRRGLLEDQREWLGRPSGPTSQTKFNREQVILNVTDDAISGRILERMFEFDWRLRLMPQVGIVYLKQNSLSTDKIVKSPSFTGALPPLHLPVDEGYSTFSGKKSPPQKT